MYKGGEPGHRSPEREKVYDIFIDGASRGNPGSAGAGVVIKYRDRTVKRLKRYLGITTNNFAEYSALVMALEEARRRRLKKIRILSDSELMVKQIKGEYTVRSKNLLPLFSRAKGLLRDFDGYEVLHIRREKNQEADLLANRAIDERD